MPIVSPLETYAGPVTYSPIQTGKIDLVVNRYPAGTYVDRRFVKGTPTEVTLENVSLQPFSDRQKMILPEADRSKEWLKIYSPAPLQTLKEGTNGYDPDEFEYDGIMYQVVKVRNYSMGVLNHYKALAVSIEKTPN